ncbi:albusnodin family lasso peptide [Streptomyces buecherae]|nr:albusnodin family lasso peptide [Streptomyces buecherae]
MDQEHAKEAAEDQIPPVIDLGDAAAVTRGSSSSSVESKQTPYS